MNEFASRRQGSLFQNPVPTHMMQGNGMIRVLKKYFEKHPGRTPQKAPGPFRADLSLFPAALPRALRIAWLGHSTTLLEIDGKRFLTDPVWYSRVSPFTRIGPKRYFDNPIPLQQLPPVDAILLSHDHYDHMDKGTLLYLLSQNIPLITLLGVGDRLVRWGADPQLITQLDWGAAKELEGGLEVRALPARHFSGRGLNDRFKTLWGSFAIRGPQHNVYFGADSGYYNGFEAIGRHYGPFDLTMLDTGAYNQEWADIHMGPENAIQAHLDLNGRFLMPIHWGTFGLAFHPWTEPVERVIDAARSKGVQLIVPEPGKPWDVANGSCIMEWWR